MPPELEEVKRWLEKARRDTSTVEKLLAGDATETDVAAFHAQQAVEKLLKAFLVHRAIEFEKVHDLGKLLEQCAGEDLEFTSMKDEVAPLSIYAVAYRYPGPRDPTKEKVERGLDVVRRVWGFVTERLPPEVQPE